MVKDDELPLIDSQIQKVHWPPIHSIARSLPPRRAPLRRTIRPAARTSTQHRLLPLSAGRNQIVNSKRNWSISLLWTVVAATRTAPRAWRLFRGFSTKERYGQAHNILRSNIPSLRPSDSYDDAPDGALPTLRDRRDVHWGLVHEPKQRNRDDKGVSASGEIVRVRT